MFIEALFVIAERWKQHRCPSTDGWIKKMWNMEAMEYYASIKGNEALINTTTCTSLKTIMPSRRSQSQNKTCYMIPFIWNVQKKVLYRERIGQWLPQARGERIREVIAKRYSAKGIESPECTMFILYSTICTPDRKGPTVGINTKLVITYTASRPQESVQFSLHDQTASLVGQHASSTDHSPDTGAIGQSVISKPSPETVLSPVEEPGWVNLTSRTWAVGKAPLSWNITAGRGSYHPWQITAFGEMRGPSATAVTRAEDLTSVVIGHAGLHEGSRTFFTGFRGHCEAAALQWWLFWNWSWVVWNWSSDLIRKLNVLLTLSIKGTTRSCHPLAQLFH